MREFLNDFRKFLMRGNVLDLAVAVVIGVAFNNVVQAFVRDLINPIIAAIGGKQDFSSLYFTINKSKFAYGDFINFLETFVIIAFALFLVIKAFETMQKMRGTKPEENEPLTVSEELLTEIRDLLRTRS